MNECSFKNGNAVKSNIHVLSEFLWLLIETFSETNNLLILEGFKESKQQQKYKIIEEHRTVVFWVITQRVMVISYRRFGTASRNVGTKLPLLAA